MKARKAVKACKFLFRIDRWDHETRKWVKVKTFLSPRDEAAIGRCTLTGLVPTGTVLCAVRV